MSKTILITGANRGIGLEMAKQALARGDTVHAAVRDPAAATGLNGLSDNRRLVVHAMDVTDENSVNACAASLTDAIDLIICNAGVLPARGGISDPDHDQSAWSRALMTNIAGPFFTIRAFLPHLRRGSDAKAVVISSHMGSNVRAQPNATAYRVSKAGATSLVSVLATELADEGIALGAYHPGWVRTDMGGSGADISAAESAAGLLTRFDVLSIKTTGVFEDYKGDAIPF